MIPIARTKLPMHQHPRQNNALDRRIPMGAGDHNAILFVFGFGPCYGLKKIFALLFWLF
jgi:hypothetical protein